MSFIYRNYNYSYIVLLMAVILYISLRSSYTVSLMSVHMLISHCHQKHKIGQTPCIYYIR